jgi:hypothetical protein
VGQRRPLRRAIRQDRPDGRGKYQFANGDSYEGEVKAGVIVGAAVYDPKNGDVFEGSFARQAARRGRLPLRERRPLRGRDGATGVMQGRGRYFAKSGDRIEAPFVQGKPQGIGTYHFANGDRYEGEIIDGALSGQGTYFYGSGLKYEGEMRGGRPQGGGSSGSSTARASRDSSTAASPGARRDREAGRDALSRRDRRRQCKAPQLRRAPV